MNQIDPDDEDEDEDGHNSSTANTPSKQRGLSNHGTPNHKTRHQLAQEQYYQQQQQQQMYLAQQHQQQQHHHHQQQQQQQQQRAPFMPSLTKKSSNQNMVLDPSTGMMVPAANEEDDIMCLSGQSNTAENSTNYGTQVCVCFMFLHLTNINHSFMHFFNY